MFSRIHIIFSSFSLVVKTIEVILLSKLGGQTTNVRVAPFFSISTFSESFVSHFLSLKIIQINRTTQDLLLRLIFGMNVARDSVHALHH